MSACIQVTQNPNGTWTAKGAYGGVYAEVTADTRRQAVAAVSSALYAFEPLARPS